MTRLVTIFGGGGFVGRYVAQELLSRDIRVRVAQRNPAGGLCVKPLGSLGATQLVSVDVTHADAVRKVVAGSDAVVNLVGTFGPMDEVHVTGAANIARAAAEAGVRALVHVSAIGADTDSPSAYGRTKGLGEDAVRSAFSGATIIRPSIIFGREDQFTNRFAALIRMAPVVPVIGGDTKFQPVYVVDVARAIATAATDPARCGGQTYELGGPQVLSMMALNQWIAQATGRTPAFVPVPAPVAGLLATVTGWAPGAPITRDQWKMLQKDNVVAPGAKSLADLDIAPTPMAAVADSWLVQYRNHGRFGARVRA